MRTSCVRHPEKNSFLIIREWQIRFCEGDYCAAALLSFFAYTYDWKVEQRQQAIEANNIAERHGDTRSQFEYLYQYYTYEELNKRLLGLYSERAIPQSIKLLVKLGVLTCHKNPNPKYSFDKTTYYLFHPEVCNQWLDEHYHNGEYLEGAVVQEAFDDISKENLINEDANNVTTNGNIADSKMSFLHDREGKNALPSRNFACSSGKIATAINNNTNLKKQTKNKTAAKEERCSHNDNQNIDAAVFSESILKSQDLQINEQLTAMQLHYVSTALKKLSQKIAVTEQQLQEEVIYSLSNKESFSAAGDDFIKKLNTILKIIREGRWTTPTGLKNQKEAIKQKQDNEFNLKRNALLNELKQLEDAVMFFKDKQDIKQVHFFESEITKIQQQLVKDQADFMGPIESRLQN